MKCQVKFLMKIGYPCINRTIECKGNRTFRLKSYSEERLVETVTNNLECLESILRFNSDHGLLFFRITSDLIPFASHPICTFHWQETFRNQFRSIGRYIEDHNIRISMHPDQFTLINSQREDVFLRSLRELVYHADVLELMGLDMTAKIQIHVGGVYGEKKRSMDRFIERYESLDRRIAQRLVIENDHRSYTLSDCLEIHHQTGIPVLFDSLHHALNNHDESIEESVRNASKTWKRHDGLPMTDYSLQEPGARPGTHAKSIDLNNFADYLEETGFTDIDIMLEIKDKETSALRALPILQKDRRFFPTSYPVLQYQ